MLVCCIAYDKIRLFSFVTLLLGKGQFKSSPGRVLIGAVLDPSTNNRIKRIEERVDRASKFSWICDGPIGYIGHSYSHFIVVKFVKGKSCPNFCVYLIREDV